MLQAFRPGGIPPRAQGIMGARRMPWHRKSTKGAASRDRPGGGANGPQIPGFPNGGTQPPSWAATRLETILSGDNRGN